MRVRIFKKKGTNPLHYFRTMEVEGENFDTRADSVVASAAMHVGDVAYANDFYLQLTATYPATWRCLSALDPLVDGLYKQAVACERQAARDGREGAEW